MFFLRKREGLLRGDILSKRTIYDKYREKMKRLINECDNGNFKFIEDLHFKNYGDYLIKTLKKEPEFKLYRYCGLHRYIEKENGVFSKVFLEDLHTLYLSSNGNLNDIFEGIPDEGDSFLTPEKRLMVLSKTAYIKCFTEKNNNNLMWAHYADSYKGICVEYDIKRITDEEVLKSLFPVVYSKERDVFVSSDLLAAYFRGDKELLATKDSKGVFLQKLFDWRDEKEWRICKMNHSLSEEVGVKFEFPYISAIYTGIRTPKEDFDELKVLINKYEEKYNYKIKLYKMKMIDKTYDLEFEEIH